MNVRTSLVLLILLVMVAGYLAFSQFRPPAPPSDEDRPAPWFYAVSGNDIVQVAVSYQGEEQVFFRGEGLTDWSFDDTYQTPVDLDRWGGITLLLEGPRSRRLLFQQVDDLAPYGLEDPPGAITVDLTGDREFQVLFGNRTEDGTSHYVQLAGSDPVYLVDAGWGDVLTRLVTVPPYPIWYYQGPAEQVTEVEITYQESKVSFIKDSRQGWQFNTSDRASERPSVAMERWEAEVVPLLAGPSVQYQVAPELEDPADYGLEEPFAVISIGFVILRFAEEGPVEVFLTLEWSLGETTEDGQSYYAKLLAFPEVVAVEAQWVEQFLAVAQDPPDAVSEEETSS